MPTPLSEEHRNQQVALRAATLRDVLKLWPAFDIRRISETWPAFESALMLLIRERGRTSAGLSVRYYREFRRQAQAAGVETPRVMPVDEQAILRGLRVVGPVNAARQLARGRNPEDVEQSTLVNVSGETTRGVLNAGRASLTASLAADRHVKGVRRVTGRSPCTWCLDQASRDYPPTDRFPAHSHCVCTAEPIY